MSTHTVQVSGYTSSTTETHLHDFFSFCGTIKSIDFKENAATIHFEKPSAAKTALMLNGGTLDGAHINVTSDVAHQDEEREEGAPIEQSDKPRAGIAAEYLAKGYKLSDNILQQAIEIDAKQGISKRFLSYVQSLNTSLGARALGPDQTISGKVQSTIYAATQQAKTVDEQKGISKTAGDYYTKAFASPFGQKVHAFYTTTSKQVLDIHEEARRLADLHKNTAPAPAATTEPPTSTAEPSAATTEPPVQAVPAASGI